MRKFLIALAAAGTSLALAGNSANALECYPSTSDPMVQDCYSDSGAFAYSTRAPGAGVYIGPQVYGWSSDDVMLYRAPAYPPSRAGRCGTMRYWSWEQGRCVDVRDR